MAFLSFHRKRPKKESVKISSGDCVRNFFSVTGSGSGAILQSPKGNTDKKRQAAAISSSYFVRNFFSVTRIRILWYNTVTERKTDDKDGAGNKTFSWWR